MKTTEIRKHLKVAGSTETYCFSQNYRNGVMEHLLAILEKFSPGIGKDTGAVIRLDAENIGMLIEVSHDPVFDLPEFVNAKEVFGQWMQAIDRHEGLILNITLR